MSCPQGYHTFNSQCLNNQTCNQINPNYAELNYNCYDCSNNSNNNNNCNMVNRQRRQDCRGRGNNIVNQNECRSRGGRLLRTCQNGFYTAGGECYTCPQNYTLANNTSHTNNNKRRCINNQILDIPVISRLASQQTIPQLGSTNIRLEPPAVIAPSPNINIQQPQPTTQPILGNITLTQPITNTPVPTNLTSTNGSVVGGQLVSGTGPNISTNNLQVSGCTYTAQGPISCTPTSGGFQPVSVPQQQTQPTTPTTLMPRTGQILNLGGRTATI